MERPSASGTESARLLGARGHSLFPGPRDAPALLPPRKDTQEPGGGPLCPCGPAPPPGPIPERLQARRQLSIACSVCCVFMVGEVIGGYLAHSLAIMTDAAHLLTDVGSMAVSLFSLWVSTRPPTTTMTFGWHRSETLGALASVLSIWVVTAVLLYLAAARILSADYEIEARTMLATSACAVGANLVMAYVLHQGHGHGVGGYEQLEGGCLPGRAPLPGSTSVRAAFVHVVGDLLQSVGVLLAATIIYFKPQCKIADPISTLFFSVFVLGSTVTILRDVFRVLMEGEGDVGVPRGCSPHPTALPCPSQPYGEQLPPFPSPKWRKGLGVTPWRRSPAGNGSERSDGGAAGSQWGEGHPRPTRVGVDAEPPPGVGARGCGCHRRPRDGAAGRHGAAAAEVWLRCVHSAGGAVRGGGRGLPTRPQPSGMSPPHLLRGCSSAWGPQLRPPLLLPPPEGRERGSVGLELGPFPSLCVSVCVCLCSSRRAGLRPQ
uniref:Probable proton-coupled zinc antiporter SLC30A3 n=1 Tax=Gallus gallus TaxID=9031 RepID=A0A8V0Y5I5_CHICK